MKKSISKLKTAISWLEESVELLEKDDLESILKFYQIGYKGNGWHLQRIVLGRNQEVERRLEEKMKEIINQYEFTLHQENLMPLSYSLYFQNRKVCDIDIYRRMLWLEDNIDQRINITKSNTDYNQELYNKYKNIKKDTQEQLRRSKTKRNLKQWLFDEKEEVEEVEEEYNNAEENILAIKEKLEEYNKELLWLGKLKENLPEVIDELNIYGFTMEYRNNQEVGEILTHNIHERLNKGIGF